MTVAVVGSTTIDTVVHRGRRVVKLGGVTTYSGMTYARQGVRCMLVSNVADRDRHLLRPLVDDHLMLHIGKSRHTTRFVNHIDGDRRRQEIPTAADPIEWHQLADVIDQVDIVHLGPLHPKDIAHEVYHRLPTSKAVAVLDVQGMVRGVKDHQVRLEVSAHLSDAFRACAIVKADELELQSLGRFFKTEVLDLMADFEINELVVTAGQKGGYVLTTDGRTISYASVPIQSVADPTGAGDVFFASYVTGRLIRRLSIADSCKNAAAVAAGLVAGNFIPPHTLMLTRYGSSGKIADRGKNS